MREDADLVLKMFSKNRVLYENPVNDPIFSAHKRYVVPNERTGMEFPYYLSDFPVAVVGCAQQVSVDDTVPHFFKLY
jgi:hypothetical protein